MYSVDYLESRLLDHFIKNSINIEYDENTLGAFADHIMESDEWGKAIYAYYPKSSVTAVHDGQSYVVWDAERSLPAATDAAESLAAIESDSERFNYMTKTVIGKAPMVQGYTITGTGVYFTVGQMGEEFESAVFGLELYGTSGVIELDTGYYVVMRLPLEEDEVKKQAAELLTHYQYGALKKSEDAKETEISFVGNEYFYSLSLIDIE
jgi:hypothetical protein